MWPSSGVAKTLDESIFGGSSQTNIQKHRSSCACIVPNILVPVPYAELIFHSDWLPISCSKFVVYFSPHLSYLVRLKHLSSPVVSLLLSVSIFKRMFKIFYLFSEFCHLLHLILILARAWCERFTVWPSAYCMRCIISDHLLIIIDQNSQLIEQLTVSHTHIRASSLWKVFICIYGVKFSCHCLFFIVK